MKKSIITLLTALSINTAYADDVYVYTSPRSATHGWETCITSIHALKLHNDHQYPIGIGYHYMLCVDGIAPCKIYDNTVNLPAYGDTQPVNEWTYQKQLQLCRTFQNPGHYQIYASTWITGDHPKKVESHNVLVVN